MKSEKMRLDHEKSSMTAKIKENKEKIKLNRQLPYLVSNVVEVLEMDPEQDEEEDGANVNLHAIKKGKCAVIKTTTRQVCRVVLVLS
jgi:26S proteasome regulatory subunit T5